jgi:sugar O-acyltransferase (sialic acid O-acetyltransferase NeuD family)
MTMALYAVYGASGCGRGVMPVVREQLARSIAPGDHDLVFVDDDPASPVVNGHAVLSYAAFLDDRRLDKFVTLAIANGAVRQRLAARCAADGIRFFDVRAHNAVVMDDCSVGEGAILCPFVTLTSNILVGRHFHANLYSYVEHDCVIGDFVTFAPGVHCNGNVVIEDHAYVGAGAILRQGQPGAPLVIGRGAVVGMGAVVTRNVPPLITVVGNPARPLEK